MIEFGQIVENETYEEREVVWKIPNFSSVKNSKSESSDFTSVQPQVCSKEYVPYAGCYAFQLPRKVTRTVSANVSPVRKCYQSPTFFFADNSWHFGLFAVYPLNTEDIELSVWKKKNTIYSVEYNFSVKKDDGSFEHVGSGNFKEGESGWSSSVETAKLPDLWERKSELLPLDVLTIVCTLKRGCSHYTQRSILEKAKSKNLIKLDTLSQNFKDLYCNKDSCDTTLLVKDTEYRVHRAVLIARSPVFAAIFQHDSKEKQEGIVIIPDCHPESFQEFLEFVYCGKLEDLSFCKALSLYETSEKYDVQELKAFCVEYLIQNFTVENMCGAVIVADKYNDVKLISKAQDFFNKNFNDIFQTSEWECLLRNNYRLAHKLLIEMPKMNVVK